MVVVFSYVALALACSPIRGTAAFSTIAAASLLLFFAIYAYNNVTDTEEDRANNRPSLSLPRGLVLAMVLAAAAAFLWLSWLNGGAALLAGAGALALGAMYSHESIRLKKYALTKTPSIAAGCFVFFLYLCFSLGAPFSWKTALVGSFIALTSAAGSIQQDLKDVEGDRKMGVNSIPAAFGKRAARLAIAATVAAKYAALAAGLALLAIPASYAALFGILPLRIGMVHSLAREKYSAASRFSLMSYALIAAMVFIAEANA